jgi:hypothetical protein
MKPTPNEHETAVPGDSLPCFAYASVLKTRDYEMDSVTLAAMDAAAYEGFAADGAAEFTALMTGLRQRLQVRAVDGQEPRRQAQAQLALGLLDQHEARIRKPYSACISLMKNEKATGVRYKLQPKIDMHSLGASLMPLTIALYLSLDSEWSTFFNALPSASFTYLDCESSLPAEQAGGVITEQRAAVDDVVQGRRRRRSQ